MARAWYAVHTIAGHENKVREVLTRRAQVEGLWGLDIFEILIPMEKELGIRSGKRGASAVIPIRPSSERFLAITWPSPLPPVSV